LAEYVGGANLVNIHGASEPLATTAGKAKSRRWTPMNADAKPKFKYLRLSAFISGFFFFSVNGYQI